MSRNTPCICGSGIKQKKCHPDITESSLAGITLALYAKADRLIAEHGNKNEQTCTAGCSECCHRMFSLTNVEFKLICREMKAWNDEQMEETKDNVLFLWKNIEQIEPELFKNLTTTASGRMEHLLDEQDQLILQSYSWPCPLLSPETHTCLVYNARPFICRCYGSSYYLEGDFETCEKLGNNNDLKDRVVDLTELWKSEYPHLFITFRNGNILRQRNYPLVYLLKIYFEYLEQKRGQIPLEETYFRTPAFQNLTGKM